MAAVFPYWDLTWELVQRELRVRYRRSLIGFAWTMLQPMLMMGVLHIAFSTIFRFNVDNYPVYVLAGLVTGHPLRPAMLFLPVSIAIAALFTLGAGLLLAPLAVFFHDIVELIGVILQIVLFLTPIMYPMAIVPERWHWIIRFNPVRSILEVFRDPIYYGKIPPASHLTVAALLAVALFALGAFAFSRTSRRITHYL